MSLLTKIHEASHINDNNVFNTRLAITPEMIRQARGNKMSFIALMRPRDFLKLTTSLNSTPEYFKEKCKNVDQYNQWAHEGETIIMPALWIKGNSVTGHEGRHRAAALICAGENEMPVSVRLYPEEEHEEKYGYWEAKYQMKHEDMKSATHGQYGGGIVLRSEFKVIIDGWENLKKKEQVTEARVSIDAPQVADMYDKWGAEINWGKKRDDEKVFWVTDTGYNQSNDVAYLNLKVEANSEEEAKQRTLTYLRYSGTPVPYTSIDVAGQLGATIFFDEADEWFVSVTYKQ